MRKTLAVLASALILTTAVPPQAVLHAASAARGRTQGLRLAPTAARRPLRIPKIYRPAATIAALGAARAPAAAVSARSPLAASASLGALKALSAAEDYSGAPASGPGVGSKTEAATASLFDGLRAKAKALADPSLPVMGGESKTARLVNRLAASSVGKSVRHSVFERLSRVRSPLDHDDYGGPKPLELGLKDRLIYGLNWGMNLLGISTLLNFGLKPFLAHYPWQNLSTQRLATWGRVELLVGYGPEKIAEAMAQSPYQFLLAQVPLTALKEELIYRGFSFLAVYLPLAAIRPATAWLSRALDKLPDPFNLKAKAQWGLSLAGLASHFAFPIAALGSAYRFALDHAPAWGLNPYTLSAHGALGLGLAYAAYRTKSFTAPLAAHAAYNLLSLFGGLLAIHFMMPMAAQVYGLLLSAFSVAWLYYNWRAHRIEKSSAAPAGARAGTLGVLALAAALAGGSAMGGRVDFDSHEVAAVRRADVLVKGRRPAKGATAAPQAQAAPAQPQTPAAKPADGKDAAAPAPAEPKLMTKAEVIAKAEPAVVMVKSGFGFGTGFIVSPEGLVVTNSHVVAPMPAGSVLTLKLSNGQEVPAVVVAVSDKSQKDFAILQLPAAAEGWPALPLADSSKLVKGEDVVALGHPLGNEFTATSGILSGLGGERHNLYVSHIQTDASVNPGNSGGPLLNMKGEVIGVNTFIRSTFAGGSIGLNFAIASNDLARALDQFAKTGNIETAWLGLIFDMTSPAGSRHGLVIEQVRPTSPASRAGLRPGNIVKGAVINGQKAYLPEKRAEALKALASLLASKWPGQSVFLIVAHGDRTGFHELRLTSRP